MHTENDKRRNNSLKFFNSKKSVTIWYIIIIFCVSFIIRSLYVLAIPDKKLQNDEIQYHVLAVNILNGNGFSFESAPPYKPTAHRPPGYPAILALHYFIFGESITRVMLMQVLFSSLTVLLIFFIGYYVFNNTVAYFSSLIAAFYPAFIAYNGYLLTETLNTFFVTLFALLLLLSEKEERHVYKMAVASGTVIGVINLIRPVMLLYPFILLAVYYAMYQEKRIILKRYCIIIAAFILIITPWIIRNYIHFGRVLPIAMKGYGNLWYGRYGVYTYEEALKGNLEPRKKLMELREQLTSDLDPVEKDWQLFLIGLKEMLRNPWEYCKAFWYKIYILWRDPIGMNVLRKYSAIASYLLVVFYRLLFILSCIGMITGFLNNKVSLIPLSFIIYFSLIHGLLSSIPRYHFPVLPVCIIFAVYGFCFILTYVKNKIIL